VFCLGEMKGELAGGGHFFYPVVAFLAFFTVSLVLAARKILYIHNDADLQDLEKRQNWSRRSPAPAGRRRTPNAAGSHLNPALV
jgi:hypothetical protein